MSYHHIVSNAVIDSVQRGSGALVGFFFHSRVRIDSKVALVTNVSFVLSGCHWFFNASDFSLVVRFPFSARSKTLHSAPHMAHTVRYHFFICFAD